MNDQEEPEKLKAELPANMLAEIMNISRRPKLRVKSALLKKYCVEPDNLIGCACLVVINGIDVSIKNLDKQVGKSQDFNKSMTLLKEMKKKAYTKHLIHSFLNS